MDMKSEWRRINLAKKEGVTIGLIGQCRIKRLENGQDNMKIESHLIS
jgi:hypothetical protein